MTVYDDGRYVYPMPPPPWNRPPWDPETARFRYPHIQYVASVVPPHVGYYDPDNPRQPKHFHGHGELTVKAKGWLHDRQVVARGLAGRDARIK